MLKEASNDSINFDKEKFDNKNFNDKFNENKNLNERQNWLYYTRAPLMENYRDNLYREYFGISVLLSVRGEDNEKILGLSLKLIDNECKRELRINELENFLFSCIVGEKQNIEDKEYKIELEDFGRGEAKLIRFLNNIYGEGLQAEENGKLWFKDYGAYKCLSLLKDISNIRLESKVIIFADDILNLSLTTFYNEEKDLILNVSIKDFDLNKIYTFGENCDYILYKDIFYETKPSYAKIKKNIFKNSVIVSKDYIKDFCSRVLPNLKKDFNIELPEDISDNEIMAFPVQALVYLDYDGANVFSTIKFKYGSFTLDPYTNKFTSGYMFDNEEIYRDIEKENYFCETLSKYLDRAGDYTFSTADDEKIFYLCYKILPMLQDKGWTFFYSESFKSLKLNVKPLKMRASLTRDINFFEINFSFEGVKEIYDLSDIIRAVKTENKEYIRLQNGSFVPIDLEIIDYLAKMFKDNPIEEIKQKENNGYLIPMFSAPYFADMLEKHSGIELNLDDNAAKTIADIKRIDYDENPPKNINGEFRNYQLVGYKWLRKLADMSLNGILADDMGLGKSFQTIASILKEKENGSKLTSLIVAPTSCVSNWYYEIKKFAPSLEVITLTGNLKSRMKRIKAVNNYDIAIVSYSTLRRDIKFLSEKEFNYVVLDEAQHIKNANTQNAKTVKSLKSQKRLALSGTPIENGISEMWSMFDFLMPGFLGKHKDFLEDYEAPIISGNEDSADALERLKIRIAPFILRRLKTDVLKDLPP
ncbi:SNF2-related protein, partial [Brachyspira catarrhinii]